MTYRFTIIGKLPGLNDIINEGRTSIRWAARQKKHWTETTAWQIRMQSVPHITNPIEIRLTWFESNKMRDPDGISGGGLKIICDALQMAGVLKNDGWANILAISHQFAVDKENPRIVVELQEVDP